MKVYNWPRRSGRTSKLIEDVLTHNGLLICVDEARAQQARITAACQHPSVDEAYWRKHIVAFRPDRACGLKTRVYVDDADDLLTRLIGRPVYGATTLADHD